MRLVGGARDGRMRAMFGTHRAAHITHLAIARSAAWAGLLCAAPCPGVESAPSPVAAPATEAEYAPLAIRLNNRFYNRPHGFRVKDGRLTFIHLEGSASFSVAGITSAELSQFPVALRDQIAAEVVAEAKRREEEARLAKEGKIAAPSGGGVARRRARPGQVGKLAGPNGSIRYIPVEPEGGGDMKAEVVPPKGGGAVDGRAMGGDDPLVGGPRVSTEVESAVAFHGRVARMVEANDMPGAVGQLGALADITPVSRADGEYIDTTVIDASIKVLDHALSVNDPEAGEEAALVVSQIGGTRPEAVKFFQGAINQLCLMADRAQFGDVGVWLRTLEALGPSYGIALDLGRQRVARRVLKSGLAELRGLRFQSAWQAYLLSKELWVGNPDLGPIGLVLGLGGAAAIGFLTWFLWKAVDAFRDWRARHRGRSQKRTGAQGTVSWRPDSAPPRRPTTGPRPLPRQRPKPEP